MKDKLKELVAKWEKEWQDMMDLEMTMEESNSTYADRLKIRCENRELRKRIDGLIELVKDDLEHCSITMESQWGGKLIRASWPKE